MILKYSLKGIRKHKFYTITMLLELICIFISMYNIVFYNKEVNRLYNQINKFSENKSVSRLFYCETPNDQKIESIKDDYSLFQDLDKGLDYSIAFSGESCIDIENFYGCEEFHYSSMEYSEGDEDIFVKAIRVNKNFISNFGLNMLEGRDFKDTEYYYTKSNVLPIIVGYNYKNIYDVGDTIYYFDNGIKCEAIVVGILDKQQSIPQKFDTFNAEYVAKVSDNYYSLDDNIIIPINDVYKLRNSEYYNLMLGNFIFIDNRKSNLEKKEIISNIQEKVEKATNTKFNLKFYDNEITAEVNKYIEVRDNYKKTFIISFVFVTITMIVSIINMINSRKMEFGVYLFSGSKVRDIIGILYTEMLLLVMISTIISSIIITIYYRFFQANSFWAGNSDFYYNKLDFTIVGSILLMIIIYVLVIIGIPINRLRKISISELLRRND